MPKPGFLPAAVVLAALFAGGCGPTEPAAPVPVAVRVAVDSVHLVAGEGALVSAVALDARGEPMTDVPLSWTSSDTVVATVDPEGRVRALRPGRSEVTVRAPGATSGAAGPSARFAVGVVRRPDRLELPRDTFVLAAPGAGCAQTVVAALYARSGEPVQNPTIGYALADTSIAAYTTPRSGTARLFTIYLYGRRPGETRLFASSGEYRDTAVVRVLEGAPSRVRVARPQGGMLMVGDTVQLRGEVLNQCGEVITGQSASLSSSNPSVAEVIGDGRLIGRQAGSVHVRAALGALRDSMLVYVYEARLLPADTSVLVGDTVVYTFSQAASPGAVQPWPASFATSDSTVARLIGARSGSTVRVLAAAEGEASITATSGTRTTTARLRVAPRR